MKRVMIILLLLCVVVVAYAADVVWTITIPGAYVSRVTHAFDELEDMHIRIQVQRVTEMGGTEYGRWHYRITKDPNETNAQYYKRAALRHLKAMVELVEYAEDKARENAEHSAITPADVNVPDEAIQ